MKEFTYVINDPQGLHARPAGQLTKEAAKYESIINIVKGEKTGDAKKIFSIMGLCIKNGESIKITADGPDEETAIADINNYFITNL